LLREKRHQQRWGGMIERMPIWINEVHDCSAGLRRLSGTKLVPRLTNRPTAIHLANRFHRRFLPHEFH